MLISCVKMTDVSRDQNKGLQEHKHPAKPCRRLKWQRREDKQTAGHVSPKILEILIVSKWQRALRLANSWTQDLQFARVFTAPSF